MTITSIHTVTFSPCGGTAALAGMLAEQLAAKLNAPVSKDSFTLPSERESERHFSFNDLVIFAVPTYAGRIPNKILPFVQTLFYGDNTPVVPLVTFGNRSFDNSLKELRNELQQHGFYPVAAAAAVLRHVFSTTLGKGRPDYKDRELLQTFAESIAETLLHAENIDNIHQPVLPDNDLPVGPYYTPLGEDGTPAKFLKAVPVTNLSQCDHCGVCASVCPMGSVSAALPEETNGICIKCQACILKCPKKARSFTDPAFLSHVRMLEKTYQRRAETSVFF